MQKKRWYQKKSVYVPLAIVLGVLGVSSLVTLIGVGIEDELNPDYYSRDNHDLFKKK